MHKKDLREQQEDKQDSGSQLRAFLTTIKNHQFKSSGSRNFFSKRISLSFSPSIKNKDVSSQIDRRCSLPRISSKHNHPYLSKNNKKQLNQFEKHIIFNYLNTKLKMSQRELLPPKIMKRKKKKGHNKLPDAFLNDIRNQSNQTIQQTQFETSRKIDSRPDYKSIDSNKNYSLRQQPMKHYVQQKIQRRKRQWKQTNPLQLQTYFIFAKKKTQILSLNRLANQRKSTNLKIRIPSKDQLPNFIKSYLPKFNEINNLNLIKRQTFNVNLGQDSLFFGEMIDGSRDGIGILIKDNYIFQGIWVKNCRLRGLQITEFGSYTGSFRQDKKQGQGQFRWVNGELYSGQWKAGKRHGVGLWSSPNGDSYMGQWKKGIVEGDGIHKTKTGQRYEGSFHDFLKHGWGKQKFSNGDRYEGSYVEGLPHGKGKYLWQNGVQYDGDFFQGYRQGFGTIISQKGFNYKGQFVKQCACGEGEINYGNGKLYKGQVRNGKRNGKGTLQNLVQHKIFDGYWKDDQYTIM